MFSLAAIFVLHVTAECLWKDIEREQSNPIFVCVLAMNMRNACMTMRFVQWTSFVRSGDNERGSALRCGSRAARFSRSVWEHGGPAGGIFVVRCIIDGEILDLSMCQAAMVVARRMTSGGEKLIAAPSFRTTKPTCEPGVGTEIPLGAKLSRKASEVSLHTMHFLNVPENSLEVLKILENNLESLKVLKNNLESLKLQVNRPVGGCDVKMKRTLENKGYSGLAGIATGRLGLQWVTWDCSGSAAVAAGRLQLQRVGCYCGLMSMPLGLLKLQQIVTHRYSDNKCKFKDKWFNKKTVEQARHENHRSGKLRCSEAEAC
ncbi:hypothetical protein Tco_0818175 [Tanacetum coccineum]